MLANEFSNKVIALLLKTYVLKYIFAFKSYKHETYLQIIEKRIHKIQALFFIHTYNTEENIEVKLKENTK